MQTKDPLHIPGVIIKVVGIQRVNRIIFTKDSHVYDFRLQILIGREGKSHRRYLIAVVDLLATCAQVRGHIL